MNKFSFDNSRRNPIRNVRINEKGELIDISQEEALRLGLEISQARYTILRRVVQYKYRDQVPQELLDKLNSMEMKSIEELKPLDEEALEAMNKMTKKEFENLYAEKSEMSLEYLKELGGHGEPCGCGEEDWKGWQMVFKEVKKMINKIDSIEVTTGRQLVEEERERLLKIEEEKRPDWARKQFGETLTEKDGLTYPSGNPFDEYQCNVCGKLPGVDEKIIKLAFSFCDEYPCGINICRQCLIELTNRIGKVICENANICETDSCEHKVIHYPINKCNERVEKCKWGDRSGIENGKPFKKKGQEFNSLCKLVLKE